MGYDIAFYLGTEDGGRPPKIKLLEHVRLDPHQHQCVECGDWVYCPETEESAERCDEQLLCPRHASKGGTHA